MRYLAAIAMYLVSLFACAVVGLFLILIFAGPHSSALPPAFEMPVRIVAGLLALVVPLLAARLAWRRAARGQENPDSR